MPALHGRLAELELLEGWLDGAACGHAQVALIDGEPGIGKTRILEAVLEGAGERGFRVFVGRVDEVERARPFGPLVEALGCTPAAEPRRAEIARLLRGDSAAGRSPIEPTRDPGLQFRVVDDFVDLVEELALGGPVALALDDLHWADPSTLLTVRSLARRLTYLPLALLLTLRPMPRGPSLEQLLDVLIRDGAHRLALGPLEQGAVTELVAELVAAEPTAALLEEVAGAAGNPMFVTELVGALGEEGAIELIDGRAELLEVSLPPSLRLTILRRLSFLDEKTLELLQVASVLGSACSLSDVATVLGRSTTRLLEPVREAVRAGVLEEREARLSFRHDLIREAIYEDLPENARAALHLEAGRRFAAAGAPTLRVAEQLALGAQPGDSDAVAVLHAAARQAARRAPGIAVELLERALALVADADELRPRLLADLVPTLLWSGRPQDAEARAEEALAPPPPPELEGTLRLGLVEALSAQGRHADVIEEVRRAIGRPALTADLRSQLQAEMANALGFVDDLESAERAAREAVVIGTPVRSKGAEMGLLVLSDLARVRGKAHEALEHAGQALELAGTRRGARLHWPPEVFLAMTLQQLDRFEDAHEALREGRRADEQLGNVAYLPVYHYESATMLFRSGQWDDAVAQAQAGLSLADEVGLEMLLSWPYELLALIAVHRDGLDTAMAWLDAIKGRRAAEPQGLARGLLEEARGDAAGALATLAGAWDRDAAHGIVYRRRTLGPDLVRLALAAGDRERADAVAAGVEEAAELASVPSLEGAALRCRGLVEDDGDLLVRSVEAYRRSPRTFERAAACEDASTALARAGRVPEASPLFDEALSVYEQVRAHRDTARALASMRELGLGRKRRGARKRPSTGWDSLTPSELEVVRLAAEGLTNPQIGQRLFISRRTVQTHLAHAFRKLDLSSRVELAAEAARRDGV
jgi:DNA-binding CsgD family transcriptional regulator/DNA-binding Lrp family transcriptional regulator